MTQVKVITEDVEVPALGHVYLTVQNLDGTSAKVKIKNKVLLTGRNALVRTLANDYTGPAKFYVVRVLFGTSGTLAGAPRMVDDSRTGLFGPAALAKPVIATVDEDFPGRVTFTTTVTFAEMIGQTINEMALEMANGDLFSMTTMGDINKSASMQLVWNWHINFLG